MAEPKIPKFALTRTSVAKTYHFKLDPPDAFGWALCTVNDGTGELLITSDYGNWSHRWSADPNHLGAPTLTDFIADRGAWDYLARKLLGRSGCYTFDAEATVAGFRRQLCERRLAQGAKYAITGVPPAPFGRALTRELAREMWDTLGEIGDEHGRDERGFVEKFLEDDDLTWWISERPFDELQHKESLEYQLLAKGILPALIEACVAEVKQRNERHEAQIQDGTCG